MGSFGTVWKAYAPEINRLVAIKEITRSPEGVGATADEMLAGEVRALAAADCPSVMWLYDTFREGDDRFIITPST
ncbi:hypothetical protein [Streptomyces sp. NBC_01334]|uniref:hypothetical protein n=1 Tax=Streptomyces sp. NBC_01334 TaxID=2903827 RepID=UPI003FA3CE9F|nr:hypothetical protein OG736_01940 [Streptomyces sp. NBC_01334]